MSYDDRDSMINRVLPLDLRVRRVDPRALLPTYGSTGR